MHRILAACCLLAALSLGCRDGGADKPYDYTRDAPVWLKATIDSLSAIPKNVGTRVCRYQWRGETLYHIIKPVSSCMYCELYDEKGNKYHIANEDVQAFIDANKHETLVWAWTNRTRPRPQ